MQTFDVAVIGAGAAGMMCAAVAGQLGASVMLIDHSPRLAEKIRISGGGRCNFTNMHAGPANFVSENPHFCRSALARYTPTDFIALVKRHGIAFHEKHKGQLFCDESAERIIDMLRAECDAGRVAWRMPCAVQQVRRAQLGQAEGFELECDALNVRARTLVIATGGLSIPKIGATDFGYRIARQFGHRIIETRPALVPLTFDPHLWSPFSALSGVSIEAQVRCGQGRDESSFLEDLLITHRGLSGPAILQISTFWRPRMPITIDLAPGTDIQQALLAAKRSSRQAVVNVLGGLLPRRLAQGWLQQMQPDWADQRLAELPDRSIGQLSESMSNWIVVPSGTEGYRKAEVTSGGVDTRQLSSGSMESQLVPGLYFVGEVLDVTGWLGGYNFQWAWASGHAAGMACAEACR